MNTAIITSANIFNHPTRRMDAGYHIGKKQGKKSFKKQAAGELVEDDINGKVMLFDGEASEYNEVRVEANNATAKFNEVKKKLKID